MNQIITFFELKMKKISTLYKKTRYIREALTNNIVALTIARHTLFINRIKGLQILGNIAELHDEDLKNSYMKTFPVSDLLPFKLWAIAPYYIKMTNNTLGFGKKIIWKNV